MESTDTSQVMIPAASAAMTTNDNQRATIVAAPPSSPPRLHLAPVRAGRAVLDGGWWPRSWDPVAELPGPVRGGVDADLAQDLPDR